MHQLGLPFKEEGFEIDFPRNNADEFLDVSIYPKYYKIFPSSYAHMERIKIEAGVVPFKISDDGAVPQSHAYVCELVDVNDYNRICEIDFEIED